MSGNFIAERKAAKLRCEWLVARSGCSGALSKRVCDNCRNLHWSSLVWFAGSL